MPCSRRATSFRTVGGAQSHPLRTGRWSYNGHLRQFAATRKLGRSSTERSTSTARRVCTISNEMRSSAERMGISFCTIGPYRRFLSQSVYSIQFGPVCVADNGRYSLETLSVHSRNGRTITLVAAANRFPPIWVGKVGSSLQLPNSKAKSYPYGCEKWVNPVSTHEMGSYP
jgi:hypothetical protein